MSNYLTVDYSKCTGCRLCEMACAWHNEHSTNPECARIHVYAYYPGVDIPMFCAKCPDTPCVQACKFHALSVDNDGCVHVDRDKCVGCNLCAKKCRSGCIVMHPMLRKPLICDHCGGEPSCVQVCQTNALAFAPIPFDRTHLARKREAIRDELRERFE